MKTDVDLTQYAAMSELEKARLERNIWDRYYMGGVSDTRTSWLVQELGADPQRIRWRSNLLKCAGGNPEAWGPIEQGTLTYPQVLKQYRQTYTQRPRQQAPETTSRSVPPVTERFPTGFPQEAYRSLYNEVRGHLYQWLREHQYIQADLPRLASTVSQFLAEFDEDFQSFAAQLERLQNTDRSIRIRLDLTDDFMVLGLDPVDMAHPNFGWEQFRLIRRRCKQLSGRFHPDRNGGSEVYLPEYLRLVSAMRRIEEVYYRHHPPETR